MKKIINSWYIEDNAERVAISEYSDGFIHELEDGTKVYTMTTDVVAHKVVKP